MYLQDLENVLEGCRGRRVAVVGDIMLDRYIWGKVNRISPEAPVPVVSVERRSHSLGGSANVVNNLAGLGAVALPLGVVGVDSEADVVANLLREAGIETNGLIADDERPTTLKTRIIAHEQHVVRVDEEKTHAVRGQVRANLLGQLEEWLPTLDALIFQDYNKGVLTADLIAQIRQLAEKHGVYTAVDPKFENFSAYGPVNLFKPNQKEILEAMGESLKREDDLERIGRAFIARTGCRELVVTRGSKGMACFARDGELRSFPALRHAIVDVSGAGDTVIAALVLARIQGQHLFTAAQFAGLCAAVACSELGAVPVSHEAIRRMNEWSVSE